jgi:Domain of unknown function (DUF397)
MAQRSEDVHSRNTLRIELAGLPWRRSSYSIGNGQCLETAQLSDGRLAVQDSKNPGPALVLDPNGWRAFVAAVKGNEFRPR